jgi:hypothetical protein
MDTGGARALGLLCLNECLTHCVMEIVSSIASPDRTLIQGAEILIHMSSSAQLYVPLSATLDATMMDTPLGSRRL